MESNHSVFGADGASGSGINNNATSDMPAAATPGSMQQEPLSSSLTPLTRPFEPPPPTPPLSLGQVPLLTHRDYQRYIESGAFDEDTNADRHRQQQHQHRYRAPTRVVGSDNSLVAENASEMRRRYARVDMFRRLSASRRLSTRSSGSISEESLRSSASGESEDRFWENVGLSRGRGESVSGEREQEERIGSGWQWSGQDARPQTQHHQQQPHLGAMQGRLEYLLSRTQTRTRDNGGSLSLFGGLGLPPRSSQSQSGNGGGSGSNGGSGGGSNLGDRGSGSSPSTGVSMYPGVVPPPPRPRLHSVRNAPPSSAFESTGFNITPSDGHRRSSSWSQGSLNVNNTNTTSNENRPPMSSEEAWITMLGLRLPPDYATRPPLMHLYTDSGSESGSGAGAGDRQRTSTRTSIDSYSSSNSSMTDSFMGSGVTNSSVYAGNSASFQAPNRAMFLDTELPSPGLDGLLDALGNNLNNTATTAASRTTRNPFELPFPTGSSSAPPSAPASATTFNSSNSSGFFSSASRFTPSPIRTSDEDVDGGTANESARLRHLVTRLGDVRNEVSEMMNWWDRVDGSGLQASTNGMDIDGEQRGRTQSVSGLHIVFVAPC